MIERLMVALWFMLPSRWRNRATLWQLGHLTAADPRLRYREVPTITVQEITHAMKATD